jgi:chitodextrinase
MLSVFAPSVVTVASSQTPMSADIGNPAIAGQAWFGNGAFVVEAAGAGVRGSSDQFRYVYYRVAGDQDVVARATSFDTLSPTARGGLMIRQSLVAAAANATFFASPATGLTLSARVRDYATTAQVAAAPIGLPTWLKLSRRGSTISASRSVDGVTWTLVGKLTMPLTENYYVGLAVTSGDPTRKTRATFDNVSLASNLPPTATLTAPVAAAGGMARAMAPATVQLTANASDPDGTIAKVDFMANGKLVGTATASPYAFAWPNVAAGTYILTAVARDNRGLSTTSSSVMLSVGTNAAPSVSLTSPANAALFPSGAAVTLSAVASDIDGTVAKVDFFAGTTLIASTTTSPYQATWANPPVGSHTLMAVATDNAGAVKQSVVRGITVKGNAAPTVALSSPAAASFVVPATIAVGATAADSDGKVASVAFYAGSTLIGKVTASPYAITWSAPVGTHVLTAVATDDGGATATSAVKSITVKENSAPTVALTTPAASATFAKAAPIAIAATAADTDGTVAKVVFYAGSTVIGMTTASPHAMNWTNAATGAHVITAVATDDRGATTTSASRTITVKDNTAPFLDMRTPVANASFTKGAPISLTAVASDADGAVAKVVFYAGSTVIATVTTSPYSTWWSNAPAGTHVLTAVATDNLGATTTSSARTVTVKDSAAPTVSLTSPEASASFMVGATLTLTASASDSDGTIAKVAFYAGSTLVGTATASPYAVSWPNVSAGTYTLTAVATDNAGLTTTSAARNITVKDNTAPTVSLTAPANSENFVLNTSIPLAATAADSDGTVTKVEFYAGSTLVASDASAPYSVSWSNALEGTHAVTAVAYDSQGGMTVSAARDITVTRSAIPSKAVFTPASNHTDVQHYELEIYRVGSDPNSSQPVKVINLGLPPLVAEQSSVDIRSAIESLELGDYFAVVVAVSSEGSFKSDPSPAFTR